MTELMKLGLHIQLANRIANRDGAAIQKPWPLISVVIDPAEYWWLDERYKYQPKRPVMARFNPLDKWFTQNKGVGTGEDFGNEYADRFLAMSPHKGPYWRTDEVANIDQWIADFNLTVMKRLNAAGYRWCACNYSEGSPKQPPYDAEDGWLKLRPVFDEIDRVGPDMAIAGFNSYWVNMGNPADKEAHLTRWSHGLDLTHQWGDDNVLIGAPEIGPDLPGWFATDKRGRLTWKGPDFNTFINNVNAALQPYPRFIGGAWFDISSLDVTGDYFVPDAQFDHLVEMVDTLQATEFPPAGVIVVPPTNPPPQPPPVVNLVLNPDFGGGTYAISGDPDKQRVPIGWRPVGRDIQKLHVELEDDPHHVLSGNQYSGRVYQAYEAGVVGLGQTVAVQVGHTYDIRAKLFGWCTDDPVALSPSTSPAQIALLVDPAGSIDLTKSGLLTASLTQLDQFVALTLSNVKALSSLLGVMTVIAPLYPVARTDLFIGHVEIVEVATIPTKPTPPYWARVTSTDGLSVRIDQSDTSYRMAVIEYDSEWLVLDDSGRRSVIQLPIVDRNGKTATAIGTVLRDYLEPL